jgi:multiple sugar transport system substrate-binding protein
MWCSEDNNMRKSQFFGLALALMLMLTVSGLTAAQDQVSITLAGWSSSDAENEALQNSVNAFMEANPSITVEVSLSPSYVETMQTAFASGDYPEVFYIDSSKLPDWAEAGVVAPAGENIAGMDDIYPSLLEVFTYEGTLYCPPKDFSTMTLQYNKDLFDAAGVAYPTGEWTWDDLSSASETLTGTNADGQSVLGLVTPPNLERWMPFLFQAGGAIFDDEGNLTINSPEALEALNFYVNIVADGFAGPPSAVDAGWGGEAFGNGRVAMAMEGNWVINYLKEQFPDLNWGVAPLPVGPAGPATMAFTVCYGVAANAEGATADAAWSLVNFLTGPEGALMVAETSFGVMPGRASAADAWLERFGEEMAPFVEGAEYAHKWQLPVGFQPFIDAFNDGLQQAFSGQLLPEDVLAEAESVGQEILGG